MAPEREAKRGTATKGTISTEEREEVFLTEGHKGNKGVGGIGGSCFVTSAAVQAGRIEMAPEWEANGATATEGTISAENTTS